MFEGRLSTDQTRAELDFRREQVRRTFAEVHRAKRVRRARQLRSTDFL
jgi:hypothetical protein